MSTPNASSNASSEDRFKEWVKLILPQVKWVLGFFLLVFAGCEGCSELRYRFPSKTSTSTPQEDWANLRSVYNELTVENAKNKQELESWKAKKAEFDAWKALLDERQKNLVTAQKQVTAGLAKMEEAAATIEKQKETIKDLNQKVKDLTAQLKGVKK